jgi:hypothetical protein
MPYRRMFKVRRWVTVAAALAAAVVMVVVPGARPAGAIPTDPTDNPCVSNSTASLSVSKHTFVAGETATLSWNLNKAPGCGMTPWLYFIDAKNGLHTVLPNNTAVVSPPTSGSYELDVFSNGYFYVMAQDSVTVSLPTVNGHPLAAITRSDQAGLFVQGVSTQDAVVTIRGDVNLDLSNLDFLDVAQGVQIIGERDAFYRQGPRLFTTTFPRRLLVINHDDVRVSGIRFDGMEGSDVCQWAGEEDDSDAIGVLSSKHVEIDHNELHHWRGSAINVQDEEGRVNRDNAPNTSQGDWIHDNYIHDNQHPTYCGFLPWESGHGAGYGVAVGVGGFPLIENNVFSDNRHSITSDGWVLLAADGSCTNCQGSGYFLFGNLFLRPGVDDVKDQVTNYNHPIDVHGEDDCHIKILLHFESYDCGLAGEYFEVGHNTVASVWSDSIQLRGIPTSRNPFTTPPSGGMQVYDNAFAKSADDALTLSDGAAGLYDVGGNHYDQFYLTYMANSPSTIPATCDFDGDAVKDPFMATGAAMYYYSSLLARWIYLVTSSVTAVTLADVNGDGRCDVGYSAGTLLINPGLPDTYANQQVPVPNLIGGSQAAAVSALANAGLSLGTVTSVPNLSPAGTVLTQSPANANLRIGWPVNITVSNGGITVPNVTGAAESNALNTLSAAGLSGVTVSRPIDASPVGTVLWQSLAAGSVALPGAQVQLSVSAGRVTVPNVLSWDVTSATNLLNSMGLQVTTTVTPSGIDQGTVLVQNPSAGTQVASGTTVHLSLASGPTGGGGGGGEPAHPL